MMIKDIYFTSFMRSAVYAVTWLSTFTHQFLLVPDVQFCYNVVHVSSENLNETEKCQVH